MKPLPAKLSNGVNEETTIMLNRTARGFLYPGTPLDSEARQIKLPGCELISVLGMGGMGCVYLGRQINLNRLVAIKALKVDTAHDPKLREWLKNEAVTMGAINHPNVVSCYEVIYSKGQIFVVMEYVPGFMSVRNLVKKYGPLPEDIVLHITLETLYGLSYVYGKGFIHRDVKPDNILVYNEKNLSARSLRELFNDTDTRIKICDFGIAVKAVREAIEDKGRIIAKGSPNYMAPEQIIRPDNIDFRADMYALAGTVSFMLTGKAPFQFEDMEEMFAYKLEHDIPRLNGKCVSNSFARILAKMGCVDPDERYGSYAELRKSLEEILPSIEKSRGFRRMRFWRILSILLAMCLIAGAFVFGKDYVVQNFFNEKFISLTSTIGYWQGDRTGWYVWQMPTPKGRIPVLMGDDMLGELKLVQLLEVGHTLELYARRKRPGSIHFRLVNEAGDFLDLLWYCNQNGDSIFSASSKGGRSAIDGIAALDGNGWYRVQFKSYRKNLIVFVNDEPVYTGFINGSSPFSFSIDATNVGQIMLKNMNINKN